MSSPRNRTEDKLGDQGLARTAGAQNGVVSLTQLRDLGISRHAAKHRVGAGRLHRVHRGVYAVGHEAIGRHGRLLAAVLACGEGSVISHGTAAALWGLCDRMPELVDVTVPCETGRKVDGIQARRCRYPDDEEMFVHEGVPCTTPSRTLVDLAGVLGAPLMRRVVERTAVLKLLDIDALDAAIQRAKGRPGMPALRAILIDWRPIALDPPRLRSDFEARVLSLIAERDLPRPKCNQVVSANGYRIEVDFLWEEQRLVVEADGRGFHDSRVAFERDRRRDQNLGLAGYRVVRFTWNQVTREPEATARILRRLLASHGSHVIQPRQ